MIETVRAIVSVLWALSMILYLLAIYATLRDIQKLLERCLSDSARHTHVQEIADAVERGAERGSTRR